MVLGVGLVGAVVLGALWASTDGLAVGAGAAAVVAFVVVVSAVLGEVLERLK